ncbi:efflux RND transporter periplasmic adaptor subunit, partial [Streptococcus agalactiae]|nr:efflux RND transporter periplasmic adaptor subunit [Streptococcus agalactiae]
VALAVALGLMLSGVANAEEEEGKLELTEQQIQAAGIELAEAQPQSISTLLTLPGEVRFDEDRTSHIVPRAAGVVESVKVN